MANSIIAPEQKYKECIKQQMDKLHEEKKEYVITEVCPYMKDIHFDSLALFAEYVEANVSNDVAHTLVFHPSDDCLSIIGTQVSRDFVNEKCSDEKFDEDNESIICTDTDNHTHLFLQAYTGTFFESNLEPTDFFKLENELEALSEAEGLYFLSLCNVTLTLNHDEL